MPYYFSRKEYGIIFFSVGAQRVASDSLFRYHRCPMLFSSEQHRVFICVFSKFNKKSVELLCINCMKTCLQRFNILISLTTRMVVYKLKPIISFMNEAENGNI